MKVGSQMMCNLIKQNVHEVDPNNDAYFVKYTTNDHLSGQYIL